MAKVVERLQEERAKISRLRNFATAGLDALDKAIDNFKFFEVNRMRGDMRLIDFRIYLLNQACDLLESGQIHWLNGPLKRSLVEAAFRLAFVQNKDSL